MHTSPVHKAPGLIVLLPLIVGIILARHFVFPPLYIYIILAFSFVCIIILQTLKIKKSNFSNRLFLPLSCMIFISLGICRYQDKNKTYDFSEPMTAEFCATVISCPIEKENSYRIDLTIDSVYLKSSKEFMGINIISYFKKCDKCVKLLPGERIRFKSTIESPPTPLNPEDFDYKAFLSDQNIFATCYVSSENWEKLNDEKFSLKIIAARIQNYVVNLLKAQNYKKEELALLSALTVGYKQLLDVDQKEAFMASGATHVLAVSGLHVGIIYLLLLRIFKIFGDSRRAKIFRSIIIILSLWCFAFITGLTPSVSRATLMFSMVAIGEMMKQRNNTYNTLCLSAFILLIINPKLIFSLSFQLSYTALIGIVAFQPMIADFLIKKCRLPKFLGDLIAVSIAAQIGTAPISIHTFNAFPNYFILTNIWIIPLVSIIVNGAVLLIIISALNIPAGFISIPLGWLLKAMNTGVNWISKLPYALNDYLYIDKLSVIILYILMIFLLFAIHYHSKKYLLYTMICTFLLLFQNLRLLYQEKDVHKLYIFSNRNTFNICAQQGLRSNILYDTEKDLMMPDYFIKHYLAKKNSAINEIDSNYKNYNLIRQGNFVITPKHLYATYSPKLENHSKETSLEALFIIDEEPKNIYELYENIKFRTLVFQKRPEKHINYFRSFCKKNDIKLHLLYEDGAYIAPL